VLKAYQVRMKSFRKDARFKYCQVFKNRGNRAGASMTHSHSQVLALPIVTHNIEDELRGAKEYYDTHGRCIFCDVVAHESAIKTRLIDENEHFVTVAPYAPRFPYETWLVPKRHSSNYETVGDDEVSSPQNMSASGCSLLLLGDGSKICINMFALFCVFLFHALGLDACLCTGTS
jgi:UDPglucose--hexose-1-phosphate uridylyltransferase